MVAAAAADVGAAEPARGGRGNCSAELDSQYFDYYSSLANQQTLLDDSVRTEAFCQAICGNGVDFKDKVVIDVGAGTGVLSFFAVRSVSSARPQSQLPGRRSRVCHSRCRKLRCSVIRWVHGSGRAGAAKVFAIEASGMARCCRALVAANGLEERIVVIHGTVESVELPEGVEGVDVIISEPMGLMLFHEQMIDSFLCAR